MKYALDTNTVVYYFKGLGGVPERLAAVPPADVGIPIIVLYELEVGIAKSERPERRRRQLAELIRVVDILPFGPEEARVSATIRAELERQGTPIGPLDTLIAGTAAAHGRRLVTRNVQEFARVPGLTVENWYD